jgi:hypothetical protein
LGCMRLTLTPSSRSGIAKGPRMGTGICMCCQQPLQIMERDSGIKLGY